MAKITKDSKGKIKIFYDEFGNSLVVWFGSPSKESYATEIDDDTVLMKDKDGNVIGLEKLNYLPKGEKHPNKLPVEVVTS